MDKRLAVGLMVIVLLLYSSGCTQSNPRINNSSPNKNQNKLQNPSPQENSEAKLPEASPGLIPASQEPLRFIIMADSRGSDNGVNTAVVKQIMKQIKHLSPQPAFAVMPGDLTGGSLIYSGIKAQLDYFRKIVTQFYPVEFFYPGIGNHEMRAGKNGERAFADTFSEFKANFLEGYNKTVYYIDAANTRIFMLNSDHPGEMHKITGKQLIWLKRNIDPSIKNNIFLLHEPPYPTGAEAGNSLDRYPASRDAFWKVVESSNNPIVFCGHEHNYSRRLVDNSFSETSGGIIYKFNKRVYQVITGGFGAPLYTRYTNKKNMIVPVIPQYHFAIVDISKDGVKVKAVNVKGKVIDSF